MNWPPLCERVWVMTVELGAGGCVPEWLFPRSALVMWLSVSVTWLLVGVPEDGSREGSVPVASLRRRNTPEEVISLVVL